MKAIIQNNYGLPDVLELKEIKKPVIQDNEVLVRARAAALHAGDYFCLQGKPFMTRMIVGFPKPKNYIPGFDIAGEVEEVGVNVTRFQPGDQVFGACNGGCAEFVCAKENNLAEKPSNLSFEQAAAIPTSALAALHGLRNAGKVQPGQKVLINGASGGVGTFAVQIAKALGAEVTGVCSTRNVDLIKSIGADFVIDYTKEDFTKTGKHYDLILDNVASRSFSAYKRVLNSKGVIIPNSGHAGIGYVIKAMVRSIFRRQQGRPYLSMPNQKDMLILKELAESGKLAPVVDKTYMLSNTAEAMAYLGEGHARGKVVITVETKE
ncbi:MAG: NAD(P)-dependent alcohol dehydrogenase [Bacteroidales bacterium]|nr:NAD(P)-dependent alcohol dehydrogenase [Bacteroidales bacterium]